MAWRRARRGGWLAVRVAALLALPASAPAEPIATLGHGANPSAVVDAAGTLHAVWDRTGIGDRGDSTMYCRLPAGATSCQSVSLPDLPVGTPPAYQASILLRPADGALFVVVYVAPPSTWWQDHGQAGDIRAVPLVSAAPFSRTGSRAIGQRRITIPVRRGCIRPGARFVDRLLVSGRRAGAQIVSVRFFFDADQLPRVDRKAPYRITYRLSFPPLSRHVAVARVAYRTSGHTHTTTVGRIIVMCPA